MTRTPLRIAALLLLVIAPAAAAQTLWYTASIGGQPAGWMRADTTEDEGLITTSSEMELSIRRGAIAITISMTSTSVETDAGEPVSMISSQKLGPSETVTEYTFNDDGIRAVTLAAGQRTESVFPLPEPGWLMPAAAGRAVERAMDAGEDVIRLRVMDPAAGATPSSVEYRDPRPATVTVNGEVIEGTAWTVESDAAPGVLTTEVLDETGESLRSTVRIGAIDLEMVRATEAEVAQTRDTPVGEAPELLVSTFVKPSRSIENPRKVRAAVYTLSLGGGEIPEPPAGAGQTVEQVGPGVVRVRVNATPWEAQPGTSEMADLLPSAMINSDDPVVREMHGRATAGLGDEPTERAEAMRRFVHRIINAKNLGTALGSASDVARSRSGDCTEHAVLLAALLRADGIPARVVSGLIYADAFAGQREIFGYHMWTRALVKVDGEKRWIDLDATLPGQTHFDATHIALAETAMADGAGTRAFSAVASYLGRLEITVEETED